MHRGGDCRPRIGKDGADSVYSRLEDALYRFTSAHTATDPWDPTEVETITIMDLIDDAEPESLTQAQVNTLISLLD